MPSFFCSQVTALGLVPTGTCLDTWAGTWVLPAFLPGDYTSRHEIAHLRQGSRGKVLEAVMLWAAAARSLMPGSVVRVAATAATFWSQLCRSWAISLTVYCAGSDSYPCPCLGNLRRGCRLQRLCRAEVPV